MNADELRRVVESATRAPSVLNTQPWRFAERTDNGVTVGIDIFADYSRKLEAMDPDARDLNVSCGAAVEFTRVASRALGFACNVHLVPDGQEGSNREHVAFVEIGGHDPPNDEETRLYEAIAIRYTAREVFDDVPLPDGLVERLSIIADEFGAWLRVVGRHEDEVTLAVLLSRSDELERADERYLAELAKWLNRPEGSGDGIPTGSLNEPDPHLRASSFRIRELRAEDGTGGAASTGGGADQTDAFSGAAIDDSASPPVPEHPFVCILGTPTDDLRAWLQAGRALGRLLLEAASSGVQGSPMTQVTEVTAARDMLAKGLGIMGFPQMVLRLGYAHGLPTTPRRPVDSVLQ